MARDKKCFFSFVDEYARCLYSWLLNMKINSSRPAGFTSFIASNFIARVKPRTPACLSQAFRQTTSLGVQYEIEHVKVHYCTSHYFTDLVNVNDARLKRERTQRCTLVSVFGSSASDF